MRIPVPSARVVFGLTNLLGSAFITAGAYYGFGAAAALATWGGLVVILNFAEVLLTGRR